MKPLMKSMRGSVFSTHAMEYWSKDDGTLVHSDQLALVKAFVSGGSDVGFLVVVEIDDQRRAVVLADVIEAVVAAEKGR